MIRVAFRLVNASRDAITKVLVEEAPVIGRAMTTFCEYAVRFQQAEDQRNQEILDAYQPYIDRCEQILESE